MRWTGRHALDEATFEGLRHAPRQLEPPDTGFFNAGQKAQFWEIVGGCIVYVITGIIMWFPRKYSDAGRWRSAT